MTTKKTVEDTSRNTKVEARGWTLTLNNWTEDEYSKVLSWLRQKDSYILGKEIGSENKIEHLQGYFYHKNPTSLKTLKNLNNRIHWEIAKKNSNANLNYCKKDGNYITNMEKPKISNEELMTKIEKENNKIMTERHNKWIKKLNPNAKTISEQNYIKYLNYIRHDLDLN